MIKPMDAIKTHDTTPLAVPDRPDLSEPPMYQVFFINDDFTPMDFVVHVLCSLFYKSEEESTHIMLAVHHEGRGLCGVYPYEIAESKVAQVRQTSRGAGHPLLCVMEREHAER